MARKRSSSTGVDEEDPARGSGVGAGSLARSPVSSLDPQTRSRTSLLTVASLPRPRSSVVKAAVLVRTCRSASRRLASATG